MYIVLICTYVLYVHRSSRKVSVIRVKYKLKLTFLNRFLGKSETFHVNPSGGSLVGICGQTDGQNEGNSRSLQFCEGAYHITDLKNETYTTRRRFLDYVLGQ
jgi:hypothetical protein